MSLSQVETDAADRTLPASPALAQPQRNSGVDYVVKNYVFGLAGRLLALMVAVVVIAVALLYASRLTAVEDNWARDKIASAFTAAQAFAAEADENANFDLNKEILDSIGAKGLKIVGLRKSWVLAPNGASDFAGPQYDVDNSGFFDSARLAAMLLFSPQPGNVVLSGHAPVDSSYVTVTVDGAPLRTNLLRLSGTFLTLWLSLSVAVTLVLWAALWSMVIQPVRRLTTNIMAFAETTHKHAHVIVPSGRTDEIGRAETALAEMQKVLADELRQRKRLAELGMAVARINHDLRNMLSAAQLISDRLATIPDPLAQRLAPRLVSTLDRAIDFCQATLAYGAGREREPEPRTLDLRAMVRQIVETAEAEQPGAVLYAIDIPPKFEIFADLDHVTRIMENLTQNARKALAATHPGPDRPRAIRFAAIRAEGEAIIEISDNGPGFPVQARERLFEPFHTTTTQGGSGLGLAIAADLVERNHGSIALAPTLAEDFYCGARFLIRLPTSESSTPAIGRGKAAA